MFHHGQSVASFAVCAALAACSSTDSALPAAPSGAGGVETGIVGTGGVLIAVQTDAAARQPPTALPVPSDFVPGELGGYALGDRAATSSYTGAGSSATDGGSGCDVLVGVVRDFRGVNEPDGHPDFEAFDGKGVTLELVAEGLGSDQKPVYASHCEADPVKAACPYGQMTTSMVDFDQWYRFADGVNQPYLLYLLFERNGSVFTFSSKAFFPLDDAGWGNSPHKSHHNFGFTTELHTTFEYRGGEAFTFTGDDDVWVFVNGKLAIDLGGLHPSKSQTLTLDDSALALGISPGNAYTLDLFHAERHSASSNFRVDTTLAFTNCGVIVPEPVR